MDENLRQRLLAASSNASLTFPQEFRLPFGDALVDASVCCGAEARPLSGVVDQPSMFPKGSYLQLPKEVDSRDAASNFIRRNLPGCEVEVSGGSKKSGVRPQSWSLACKCYRIAKQINPADFEAGCVAKKGTKKETVKRCDFDHMDHMTGIVEATEGKKKRNKKRKHVSGEQRTSKKASRPQTNRTSSYRAKDKMNRCVDP